MEKELRLIIYPHWLEKDFIYLGKNNYKIQDYLCKWYLKQGVPSIYLSFKKALIYGPYSQ